MKQRQVLRTVFPEVIAEIFDFIDYREEVNSLEYWLDEHEYMSLEYYKKGTVSPYGFTDYKTIQDFPIRGTRVFISMYIDANGLTSPPARYSLMISTI